MILQPFRSVKIDTFSYISRYNPTRTRWGRVHEKKVPLFYLLMCFLTKYFKALYKGFSICSKKTWKLFFHRNILKPLSALSSWKFFLDQDYVQLSEILLSKWLNKNWKNREANTPFPKPMFWGVGLTAILVIFLVMS